jgi:hypothetical protein
MKKLLHFLLPAFFGFPVLSAQLVSQSSVVTGSTTTISWITDVPTGTRAQVTPDTVKVALPSGKTTSTSHQVVVSNLRPDTAYTVVFGTSKFWLGTNTISLTNGNTRPAHTYTPGTPPSEAAVSKPGRGVVSHEDRPTPPPTKKIWGNLPSLQDHYERHGKDFGAKSPDDYAQMAWRFLIRAKTEGLPGKVDEEGVIRVFDSKTGTFASYNRDGTVKTFFKPGSNGYFERQPGRLINMKELR